MDENSKAISAFFKAVKLEDKEGCKKWLSSDFGVHLGFDVDGMIDSEITRFRSLPVSVQETFLSKLYLKKIKDSISYYVYGDNDILIYSGYFMLDDKGLIRGNQCKFNIVPSILFHDNSLIRAVKVLGADKEDVCIAVPEVSKGFLALNNTGVEDSDSVTVYFALPKDTFKDAFIHVNILSKSKGVDSVYLLFPGVKHPSYEKIFPVLEKNSVKFASKKHLISRLVVLLDDGRVREFLYPELEYMSFGYSIKCARITDGLNFQWETTGNLAVDDDPFFIG